LFGSSIDPSGTAGQGRAAWRVM